MRAQANLDLQLIAAAGAGQAQEVARGLEQGADARAHRSHALREAAEKGHLACVKLLIPVSDPKASGSYALQLAAANGHAACVRELLPASDAKADHSLALRWAAERGHAQCVALLLSQSDPKAVGGVDELDACMEARNHGFEQIASMIEAFIEAGDLAQAAGQSMAGNKKRAL